MRTLGASGDAAMAGTIHDGLQQINGFFFVSAQISDRLEIGFAHDNLSQAAHNNTNYRRNHMEIKLFYLSRDRSRPSGIFLFSILLLLLFAIAGWCTADAHRANWLCKRRKTK